MRAPRSSSVTLPPGATRSTTKCSGVASPSAARVAGFSSRAPTTCELGSRAGHEHDDALRARRELLLDHERSARGRQRVLEREALILRERTRPARRVERAVEAQLVAVAHEAFGLDAERDLEVRRRPSGAVRGRAASRPARRGSRDEHRARRRDSRSGAARRRRCARRRTSLRVALRRRRRRSRPRSDRRRAPSRASRSRRPRTRGARRGRGCRRSARRRGRRCSGRSRCPRRRSDRRCPSARAASPACRSPAARRAGSRRRRRATGRPGSRPAPRIAAVAGGHVGHLRSRRPVVLRRGGRREQQRRRGTRARAPHAASRASSARRSLRVSGCGQSTTSAPRMKV